MFRELAPDEKKALKAIRTAPVKIKNLVYAGIAANPGYAAQFIEDCRTYGMYEALLYVENYEGQGFFKQGTCASILTALQQDWSRKTR